MTEEEKRAAIQFFGSLHAQAAQTDQNIVGRSQFVSPISPTIKNHFEQVLHAPVMQTPAFIPPPAEPAYIQTQLEFEPARPQNVVASFEQISPILDELVEIKQLLKDILEAIQPPHRLK